MQLSPRRLWLLAHRWLALTLGVLLAFVALLGAALTVGKPLDRWAHPELFSAAGAPSATDADVLEQVHRGLVSQFGPKTSVTLRPPRESTDTLWALVRSPAWEGTLYFDPATGRELGRRGEHEGAFNLLFELHSSLLLGDTGKQVLAALALVYLVLLVSGLVLWWPAHWSQAWRVELRRGPRRAWFDLHRAGGSLLGLLIAVVVVTGAYMAWRPLSGAVTALSGQAPVKPPHVQATGAVPAVPLDDKLRHARAIFPDGRVGYVQVPAGIDRPIRVRLRLPDDPHPNGLTSVWLHPVSGEVLAAYRWHELDPGARAYSVIYPLHTGELGGPLHTVLTALLGLTLVGLAGSGVWLWWRRRAAPAPRAAAAASRVDSAF